MSSFSSLGVGSGLDLNTLLTGLMNVERQPITILQNQQSGLQSQLSALGQVKSALSSLQSASDAIKTSASFAAFTATSSDTSIATASATTGAVGGSYQLQVTQLASAQKLSAAFASGTTFSGVLKLEVGKSDATTASGFTAANSVSIDLTGKSVADARDAINAAGIGVTATLVNDGTSGTPYHLMITSQQGGTANQIRMSGVSGLNYASYTGTGPAGTTDANVSQASTAQDAKFSIDGIAMTRSSNTVSNAIDGVTLNLTKQTSGTSSVTVNIAKDPSAVATKVNAFVTAYNNLNKLLHDSSAYNADTKTAGPLSGDYSVRAVQQQIRTAALNSVAGSPGGFGRLADAGISLQADGSLQVDNAKLTAAISDPAKDVSKLFTGVTGTDGVATRISNTVSAMLATGGLVTSRTDGVNKSISALGDRISALQDQMTTIEARYRQQFTALDTAMAQMNSTSSYLTQQLAALNK